MKLCRSLFFSPVLMLSAFLGGCGSPEPVPPSTAPEGSANAPAQAPTPSEGITGGGSTFVNYAMGKWTNSYAAETGTKVNYQAIGSGGGIQQFIKKTVDFGATDAPMKDEQIQEAGGEVLHIPVVMGAVAVTYNLPEVKEPLTLSGDVLAQIFLGQIKKWNDSKIQQLNPGIQLPDKEIVVARRADGSGTTYIFAEFLAKTSPEWKEKVGVGTSLKWPTGVAGKGNEGVAAQVKQIPYSIGYVELLYALGTQLPVAKIINAEGNAVPPTVESVTAAAADLKEVPEDLRMSITNPPGKEAYPISGLTWVLARPKAENPAKNQAVKQFLEYVLSEKAQQAAVEKNYSKLPPLLLEKAKEKVAQIQ